MNSEQIEAVRDLISFARSHAEDVFGDESQEAIDNMNDIFAKADLAEGYLNQ